MQLKTLIKSLTAVLISLVFFACSEEMQFQGMNAVDKVNYLESQMAQLDSSQIEEYKKLLILAKNDISALDAKLAELKSKLGADKNATPVEVAEVVEAPFNRFVSIQSVVQSDNNSMVTSKMAGVVTSIKVNEGSYVNRGQVIIELDNSIQMRRRAQAKNSLSFIETVYEKQKRVWEKKVGSEIEYLKAKNDYENMLDNIKLIEEELEMLKVKAPFSGVIDEVFPQIGEALSPGMPAVRLVSNQGLQIKVDFAENYLTNFKKGDMVEVYFPDLAMDTLDLMISSITSTIDAKKRTVSAYITVPSKYREVKPNMTAVTRFKDFSLSSAIAIPLNLIQQGKDTKYVYVVGVNAEGEEIAMRKEVETGEAYQDLIVITSGLEVEDRLIVSGESTVQDGKEVNILNKEAA
ncbi:MAG: efflux RND transporter periplasmic adaptor subunit [Candidatus Kapaibacteriales bacterium]